LLLETHVVPFTPHLLQEAPNMRPEAAAAAGSVVGSRATRSLCEQKSSPRDTKIPKMYQIFYFELTTKLFGLKVAQMFKKTDKEKNSPERRKSAKSGHPGWQAAPKLRRACGMGKKKF
jgi:hypothetical protein